MNQFVNLFGDRIKSYWETDSDDPRRELRSEILQYANSNVEDFKQEVEEVQFDTDLSPLPVVLEALSKNTDEWGQFYVDTLDKIFEQAKQIEKPNDILSNLSEFTFIEEDERPFVQRIVDKLYKETDGDMLLTKLAAIWTLPTFLSNPSIRNRSQMINSLQQKLQDKNWKVRYVTFKSLGFENLLPPNSKLSFGDQIRKLIFGAPQMT